MTEPVARHESDASYRRQAAPGVFERYLRRGPLRPGPTGLRLRAASDAPGQTGPATFNLVSLAVSLGLLAAALVLYKSDHDAADAMVGECLTGNWRTASVVSCGSAGAQYRVVAVIADGDGQVAGAPDACTPYPDAVDSLWTGDSPGDGHVLCLGSVS